MAIKKRIDKLLESIPCSIFAVILLLGCAQNEDGDFNCGKVGLVANSGSNWVYAVDSGSGFQLATKYPIAIKVEVLDPYSRKIDSHSDSLDSAKLMSMLLDENSFRRFKVAWMPVDEAGNPVKSGCYKLRMTVRALMSSLSEGDIPRNTETEVSMEWIFEYVRGR